MPDEPHPADPAVLAAAFAGVSELVAALAHLDAVPDEPTDTQRSAVRPQVSAVLELPAGPWLMVGLDALMTLNLSEGERCAVTVAWQRVGRCATAGSWTSMADWSTQSAARARAEDPKASREVFATQGGPRAVGTLLAPKMAVAPGTATTAVGTAVFVAEHLPQTMDALSRAEVSDAQVQVLVAACRASDGGLWPQLEKEWLRLARRGLTPGQLRAAVASYAAQLDPAAHAKAVAAGVAGRDVWLATSPSAGCSRICADLPAADAYAVMACLNAMAKAAKARGDERTIGQLRADALTGSITGVVAELWSTWLADQQPQAGQPQAGQQAAPAAAPPCEAGPATRTAGAVDATSRTANATSSPADAGSGVALPDRPGFPVPTRADLAQALFEVNVVTPIDTDGLGADPRHGPADDPPRNDDPGHDETHGDDGPTGPAPPRGPTGNSGGSGGAELVAVAAPPAAAETPTSPPRMTTPTRRHAATHHAATVRVTSMNLARSPATAASRPSSAAS